MLSSRFLLLLGTATAEYIIGPWAQDCPTGYIPILDKNLCRTLHDDNYAVTVNGAARTINITNMHGDCTWSFCNGCCDSDSRVNFYMGQQCLSGYAGCVYVSDRSGYNYIGFSALPPTCAEGTGANAGGGGQGRVCMTAPDPPQSPPPTPPPPSPSPEPPPPGVPPSELIPHHIASLLFYFTWRFGEESGSC